MVREKIRERKLCKFAQFLFFFTCVTSNDFLRRKKSIFEKDRVKKKNQDKYVT